MSPMSNTAAPTNSPSPPSSTRIPYSNTRTPLSPSPTIQLPNHPPLTTTLTPSQLAQIFPTLHIYLLPSEPSMALLPGGCMTYRGLETALRWMECNLETPGTKFSAEVDEMLEIYQALAFLGNKNDTPIMLVLSSAIADSMSEGLSLDEITDLWPLRRLPFTQPTITLMLTHLATFCRRSLERFEKSHLPGQAADNPELQAQLDAELPILNWVSTHEEVLEELDKVDAKLRKEEAWKVEKENRRTKSRYMKKGGRNCISKSAVGCFQRVLGTVEEQEEIETNS